MLAHSWTNIISGKNSIIVSLDKKYHLIKRIFFVIISCINFMVLFATLLTKASKIPFFLNLFKISFQIATDLLPCHSLSSFILVKDRCCQQVGPKELIVFMCIKMQDERTPASPNYWSPESDLNKCGHLYRWAIVVFVAMTWENMP